MKIGIMTDVNAGLDYVGYETNIPCLRSSINFKEGSYIDGIDIKADEFYERIKNVSSKEDIPSTSAPSMQDIYNKLDNFVKEGYTDIIHFPISFQLSSTGSHVMQAYENDYKDSINLHVVDTKTAGYMQGYLAVNAKKMAEDGASVEEIIARSEFLINHSKTFFVVDDLRYLGKNGRLSNPQAVLGTVFKIKPILTINEEGKIVTFEKIKTYKKAVERAINLILEFTKDVKDVKFLLFHSIKEDTIEYMKDELIKRHPYALNNIEVHYITPAVGAHIGSGVVAVGAYILK